MTLFKTFRFAPALMACAALLAGPAAAQLARDTDAPVDMIADELEVVNTECVSIWRGSAEARQEDSRLRADVLRTYFQVTGRTRANSATTANCGALNRIEAQGNVFYVTPEQRVRGAKAVYDAAADTITVTGDVVVAQGQNVLRGQRAVINVSTGQARVEGGARGRNTPGRVRGVFYPDKQAQPSGR